MNEKEKKEEENILAVKRLINIFNHSDLTKEDIPIVLSNFIYSIGASFFDNPPDNSEDILMLYAKKPTIGSALMAQGIHMRELWTEKEEEKDE